MDQDTEWALRVLEFATSEPTDIDIAMAWAAGLYEGEGSASLSRITETNRRTYLVLQLVSTDEDVVRKFQSIVKVGKVRGPYDSRAPRKPTWRWQASGRPAVSLALDPRFTAHLCARRAERLSSLLAVIERQGPSPRQRLTGYCSRNHPFDEENTGYTKAGRYCKTCALRRANEQADRRRATR